MVKTILGLLLMIPMGATMCSAQTAEFLRDTPMYISGIILFCFFVGLILLCDAEIGEYNE